MLTRSGLGVAAAAISMLICGIWWGYEELVILAAAGAAAVGVAVWSATAPTPTTIARAVTTPRVARGDPVRVVYRTTNPTRRRSAAMTLVDTFGEEEIRVAIAPVDGLGEREDPGLLPTRRRGLFDIGPWTVERVDPLRLAVGRRSGDDRAAVVVHPRVHTLEGPYGAMHTVQDEAVIRKAASDPLSGFVSLREYVDGDDPRLIHWPTSARMGTLMLREHVELRRPEFTVVLDGATWVASPDDFEEMVDVTASVAVHAIRSGVSVSVRTTSRVHPGLLRPIDREPDVLDLLTPIEQVDGQRHMSLVELFHAGFDHTSIVFVTGPDGPSTTFAHTDRLSIIRVGEGAAAGPGITLAVENAERFAQRWRPWW
jgi:uncharacterized protein (DUF58 family)